jgi:hypothetical protein
MMSFVPQILPETGRGTIRRMVEGQVPVLPAAPEVRCAASRPREELRVPLHHSLCEWSPSPKGEDL